MISGEEKEKSINQFELSNQFFATARRKIFPLRSIWEK